jgi:hypothetical protein
MSGVLDRIRSAASRVTRTVDLGDLDEAYSGATFEVCVTPSRAHLRSWGETTEFIVDVTKKSRDGDLTDEQKEASFEEYEERQLTWLAITWENITLEEAREIRDHLQEDNPLAWDWLLMKTSATIGDFRTETLKN